MKAQRLLGYAELLLVEFFGSWTNSCIDYAVFTKLLLELFERAMCLEVCVLSKALTFFCLLVLLEASNFLMNFGRIFEDSNQNKAWLGKC